MSGCTEHELRSGMGLRRRDRSATSKTVPRPNEASSRRSPAARAAVAERRRSRANPGAGKLLDELTQMRGGGPESSRDQLPQLVA